MIDIDELERLEKAATPGPWVEEIGCGEYLWERNAYKDAPLIVAMRNNIKALIECARACEFYADDRIVAYIRKCGSVELERLIDDGGQRAREALAKLRKE